MKNKNYTLVLFFISMIGCAQLYIVEKITLPNGKQGLTVDCTNYGWPACFKEAGDTCPNGYDIYERTKQENIDTKIPLTEPSDTEPSAGMVRESHSLAQHEKYMVISCK